MTAVSSNTHKFKLMRLLFAPLAFSLALLLAGCTLDNKVENGTVTLDFKALYAGQQVAASEELTYTDGNKFYFDKVSFYISDLIFVGESGDELVLDISKIDLLSTGDKNKITASIPFGQYTGVKFVLGVSPTLNAQKPSDFSSGHPLSTTSDYWDGWQSYIFTKYEARMDTDANGTFERAIVYHTGSDVMNRAVSFTKTFGLDGNNNDLILSFDVDLATAANNINLSVDDQSHAPGDLTISTKLTDNLATSAIKIK
jgi:hypothetical protein